MSSAENVGSTVSSHRWLERISGLFLFSATVAVVIWQNSHLAVLWDLSYVLENAHRMALGQMPYCDFPFPYPPLTFLAQAALIKLGGRVFWHTIAYSAVVGGASTVIAWRILRNVLRDRAYNFRALAFLLSLPLVPLGVYSIFPHPFYDPDCTFAILVSILCLQAVGRKQHSIVLPLLAGATIVTPLFIKQNTGLAFLLSAVLTIATVGIVRRWRDGSARRYLLILAGAALALAVAVLLIHFTAGLKNYWHWTIQFAAERRTPARREILEIYLQKANVLWLAFVAIGALLLWFTRKRNRILTSLAALLISIPFLWPVIYLLRDSDPSERAERLINLWPVAIVAALIIAVITIKKRVGISLTLPFILIAAINGCFMSQQLWGSTYAIWPLLMILIATMVAELSQATLRLDAALVPDLNWRTSPPAKRAQDFSLLIATGLIVLSLLVAGAAYVRSHERLSYANLDDGELKRSTLPQLKGLATRGDWIPQFEELVRYADQKIPRDEGVLLLPGEDLFYYTTGRTPRFPVLLFDHTVNPYSPEQILEICRARSIKWLVVKQDLQDEDDGVNQEEEKITAALDQDFEQVDSLGNYEIYHRVDPNKKKADDDDDDSN